MDDLVDFEALIDINEVLKSMEKVEGEIQNISQNSLIDALDRMCEVEESKSSEVTNTNADDKLSVEKTNNSPDDIVINLDDFEDIFNEMRMSADPLEKLEEKEFSITDLTTEILKETINESVDDNNISKGMQDTDVISENETVVNLDEFEIILNEMSVSSNKIENKEGFLSDTKIQKQETVSSHDVIYLDKIEDTVDDHKIKTYKKKTVTFNLYPNNAECELTVSVGHKATETLKLKETDIIDKGATQSDTDSNNFNKDVIDIISLSSDSEDDGYNSSDFEFISESEAKKNCLTKTNIQDYSYYNVDYMKYHKSRYLPCKVITSKAQRESHVIPQGETYLNLFRGMYAPAVMNNLHYASKKRVLPATSMTLQDGFGFDVYDNKCEENEEYKNEATETLKKIRFLYPDENRKRRRRF